MRQATVSGMKIGDKVSIGGRVFAVTRVYDGPLKIRPPILGRKRRKKAPARVLVESSG